jgi:hypothetical protein
MPDTPIGKLFYRIHPPASDGPDWAYVGEAVRAQLVCGEINSWGRKSGENGGLQEIDQNYWVDASFDYATVLLDETATPQTVPLIPIREIARYWDLRINGAEAFAVWPNRLPRRVPRPNLTAWDKVDRFKLWDAAWLWANQEPRPQGQDLTMEAERAFRQLEAAIEKDDLRADGQSLRETIQDAYDLSAKGIRKKADPKWIVTRQDLTSCANSYNVKPPFLFSRERT